MKKYFDGLQRVSKGLKKGLKNDDMTSFSYSFYDSEFLRTDASKQTVFYGKICIRGRLEVEKTQVVCCGHPQNIYFMVNSTTGFRCARVLP